MRTKRLALVLLVAFATLAFSVSTAAAGPGPRRPPPIHATHATQPVPAAAIVPKTAAMLLGGTYRWAQPTWVRVDGVLLPILTRTASAGRAQPPVWIPIS